MKKIKYIIICALVLGLSNSCTKNFEEINTNPNRTTVGMIQASGLFEPILYNSANNWLNRTWYYNNELIQFTAHTGGVTRREHLYFLEESRDWAGFWSHYATYGKNIDHMYELAQEQGDKSLEAIALTFKVLFFSNMTDMFGSVPYEEAFSGRKLGGTLTPKFNSQKEIYQFLFQELDKANDIYATNPVFLIPSMDGMYGGDMESWRKFNNSLYLRLLCRVSGRTEMNVGTKMTEIFNNPAKYPVFTSNLDNATVEFSGNDPYISNFGLTTESEFTSSGRKLTRQLIGMTVQTDISGNQIYVDPRLPIIGKKNNVVAVNPDNIWIGTKSGCTDQERSTVDIGTSWLNYKVFCRKNAPATYMDYAEVQFIFAEAALNGLISGGPAGAKNYYEAGLRASMEKWSEQGAFSEPVVTITSADVDTYLASPLGSWDLAADKTEFLGNQKYLALFWVGMEAYHEYRRTGFPVLTIGEGTIYNDNILPTRLGFPNSTMSTNNANASVALEDMGGANDMKTPVWWSKQAIAGGK
ncbi:MAG TPA: SusD/RagB family nutrient-binding outer membrane lipoprotein [Bacteroidales bacterium]|nr:SusD/RagB family nutrient-binding outer membrane lipoprotein [Bacteroidales bacterium]